jgi:hypothetical protein
VVTLAVDVVVWTQHLLLNGDLAKAEPKTLRYRLLHVAARLTRGQRRLWLRIQRSWPWARHLVTAFARLSALPVPHRLTFTPPTRRTAGATGRTARRTRHHTAADNGDPDRLQHRIQDQLTGS